MLDLIAQFFDNKQMQHEDMLKVLNSICLFNINDEHSIGNVIVDDTVITHGKVYPIFHERFNIIKTFKEPDEYAEESYFIIQCKDDNTFYRFSFEYDSYGGNGGYQYFYGVWIRVEQRTQTITYYSEY